MAVTRRSVSNLILISTLQNTTSPQGVISDYMRLMFQWIFYFALCEIMNIFGVVANIINVICFIKQGFNDSMNISLLGLAISDLGCLITLMWTGICYNPSFSELDLPFDPVEIQYLTAGGPHIIFARVTSCITVFITLERCLCVTMPLKVKMVLTPQRVKFIISFIFVTIITILVPGYCGSRLELKFFSERNKTLVGTVFNDNRQIVEGIIFAVGGVFVELGAFLTVIVCTVTLVVKLRGIAKWRGLSTSLAQTEKTFTRDHRVTKMVIMISTFFIICFTPTCVTLAGMICESEMSVVGRYRNLFICAFSVCFTMESVNSATNIFIYYNMSSKYRAILRTMFKI